MSLSQSPLGAQAHRQSGAGYPAPRLPAVLGSDTSEDKSWSLSSAGAADAAGAAGTAVGAVAALAAASLPWRCDRLRIERVRLEGVWVPTSVVAVEPRPSSGRGGAAPAPEAEPSPRRIADMRSSSSSSLSRLGRGSSGESPSCVRFRLCKASLMALLLESVMTIRSRSMSSAAGRSWCNEATDD